jgi:gamma-glutamyl hydrolase
LQAPGQTPNFLPAENFTKFDLDKVWNSLATGVDLDGLEFVALVESNKYPIWASQFHPEKNAFEWTLTYPMIPHSSRDRFYKTLFQSKTFRIDFHPQVLDNKKFHT